MQLKTDLTIPAGASVSNGVDAAAVAILEIVAPADWQGGVPITFQLSPTGHDDDWHDLFHSEAGPTGFFAFEVVARVCPNSATVMPPETGYGIGWLRIRSGTRAVPVQQNTAQAFSIIQEAVAS